MKLLKFLLIVFAIIGSIYTFLFAYVLIGRDGYGLGLPAAIDFRNFVYIDYNFIENAPEETSVYMLDVRTRKKLVEYMKNNNLLIKPDLYSVLTNYKFEDILEVFVFIKPEESS